MSKSTTPEIGSQWEPKRGEKLPWRLTDVYHSKFGRTAVQLEKYQGGRNSPTILTTKRLKKFFKPLETEEKKQQ